MFRFETIVRSGRESERLTTAFYLFLEKHNVPFEGEASMHVERLGDWERRAITLWSQEAVVEFRALFRSFLAQQPPGSILQVPAGRAATLGEGDKDIPSPSKALR